MVRLLITLLLACAVTGCATDRAAKAGGDGDPIEVVINADPRLNQYDRSPHALFLCLYQLKEAHGFQQLAQEKAGAARLLDCGRFDQTVVSAGQIVVQPGQELRQQQSRGEGARYLGIATGYYSLGRKRVTELSPLSRDGAPAARAVHIELGAQEISGVRVQ